MKKNKIKWSTFEFKLIDGSVHKVIHNLPDMINAAYVNWEVRTNDFTAKSFCNYINSKRERGLTDHYAYTEEEFKKLGV